MIGKEKWKGEVCISEEALNHRKLQYTTVLPFFSCFVTNKSSVIEIQHSYQLIKTLGSENWNSINPKLYLTYVDSWNFIAKRILTRSYPLC